MNQTHAIRIFAAGSFIALAAACGFSVREAHAQGGARGLRVNAAKRRPEAPRASGVRGSEDERARAFVEEGLRHAEGGRWDEAIGAYKKAVEVDPRYAEAYLDLGDAYMSSGNYREGFAAYRQAIAVAPRNADAFTSLGAAFNDMGQHGEAFKPFVTALALRPDHAEAHFGIGFAYLRLDNFREALPYLRKAARLMPDDADAHLALGQTYLGLRDVKSAEAELRILTTLDAVAARILEKNIHDAAALARETPKTRTAAATPTVPEPPAETAATQTQRPPRAPAGGEAEAPERRPKDPPRRNSSAAAAASPARPSTNESLLTVELSFWDSIKNSSDPEEFAAYLRKYPDGQFADLARIRARGLAAKAAAPTPEPSPRPVPPVTHKPAPQLPAEAVAAREEVAEVNAPTATPTPALTPTPAPTPAPTPEPAPEPTPVPTPEPAPETATTVETALAMLRNYFPSRFTYRAAVAGPPPVTSEVSINYEPLRFEGCRVEWRDTNDTLLASLAELDPDSVKVAPRTRPGTTFSRQVWEVSLSAVGGLGAITETRGDDAGSVRRYNGVDLQYEDKARAERVAAALRRTIELCVGR